MTNWTATGLPKWLAFLALVLSIYMLLLALQGAKALIDLILKYRPCPHGVVAGQALQRCPSCNAAVAEREEQQRQREAERERAELKKQIARDAARHRLQEVQRLRGLVLQREDNLRSLSPRDFEDEVARMFKNLGYDVRQTPYSNDKGKDAILRRDGLVYLVECKRYDENRSVGRPTLQKFFAAMIEEKAAGGFLVTTGYFAKTAEEYARSTKITLVNGKLLVQYMQEAYGKEPWTLTLKCPDCGVVVPFDVSRDGSEKLCPSGHKVLCDVTEDGLLGAAGYCKSCAAPLDSKGERCSRWPDCRWMPAVKRSSRPPSHRRELT